MPLQCKLLRQALTLAVSGAAWAPLVMADEQPAAIPPASAPAAEASPGEAALQRGPAATAFYKLFDEWRDLLAKIRYVQEQYQIALPPARPALVKQFNGLLEEGRALAAKLTTAAEKAYLEDTNDSKVADFLLSVAADAGRADNYEEAHRLCSMLLQHGYKRPAVYNIAGIAAFCANDFEDARQDFKQAAAAKDLSDVAKRYQQSLDSYEGAWKQESELRAAEAKADDLPRVKLVTTKGDIVVELFENEAPNTTANFISLVEKHFYDNTPFHRVLPEFMAQGGDPEGTGRGGPGYTIACECYQPNHRQHFRGSLSMANTGRPDTGGSQFFLTFVPTPMLNGKHTVFGRIVDGMDVLAKLQRIDPEHPKGEQADKILKATVVRKRNHDYTPVTKSG